MKCTVLANKLVAMTYTGLTIIVEIFAQKKRRREYIETEVMRNACT